MRLKESRVELLAAQIVDALLAEEYIAFEDKEDRRKLVQSVKSVIIDDLMVEDRLDEEVRMILQNHQDELDKRRVEYFQMFKMVKDKLIRERNLII